VLFLPYKVKYYYFQNPTDFRQFFFVFWLRPKNKKWKQLLSEPGTGIPSSG